MGSISTYFVTTFLSQVYYTKIFRRYSYIFCVTWLVHSFAPVEINRIGKMDRTILEQDLPIFVYPSRDLLFTLENPRPDISNGYTRQGVIICL